MYLETTTSTIQFNVEQSAILGNALERYETIFDPRLAGVLESNYALTLGRLDSKAPEIAAISLTSQELVQQTQPDVAMYTDTLLALRGIWLATKNNAEPSLDIAIGNESAMASYVTQARTDELCFQLYPGDTARRQPQPKTRRDRRQAVKDRAKIMGEYERTQTLYRAIYQINRRFLARGVNGGWINKAITPNMRATRGVILGTINIQSTE